MATTDAVILAAGQGTRLLPLTESIPKSLITINNGVTILENALNMLSLASVKKVRIAVGYRKDSIINRIGNAYQGMSVEYVFNKDYQTTNSMYSLYLALRDVTKPTWVIEGDVLFDGAILHLPTNAGFSWFADSSTRDLDGAYLKANLTRRVISLEIIRDLNLIQNGHCKSIGILHLAKEGVEKLQEWLAYGVQTQQRNVYYDLIVSAHLQETFVELVDVIGKKWFEIDTSSDLEKAKKIFAESF